MAKAHAVSSEQVTITHPEWVVYGGPKITKAQVVEYYRQVARWMLPDLRRRPLSVVRCPSGAEGECFFQKRLRATLGKRVGTVPLRQKSGEENHIYIEDLPGLLQLVQMNSGIPHRGLDHRCARVAGPHRLRPGSGSWSGVGTRHRCGANHPLALEQAGPG